MNPDTLDILRDIHEWNHLGNKATEALADAIAELERPESRPHNQRPNAYWAWMADLKKDPANGTMTEKEEAVAFAAFIAGWYSRTNETA